MTGKYRSVLARWAGIILVLVAFVYSSHLHDPPTLATFLVSNAARALKGDWPTEKISVHFVTEYAKCGHRVAQEAKELAPRELWQLVDEGEGFKIEETGDGVLVISTEYALCPTDAEKRTLGIAEDYLAIYKGPAAKGELEKITQIRVDELPEEWRKLLAQGTLEFDDETSLLEALDSLDEYQS